MNKLRKFAAVMVVLAVLLMLSPSQVRSAPLRDPHAAVLPFHFVFSADSRDDYTVLPDLSHKMVTLNPAFGIFAGDLCGTFDTNCINNQWKPAMNGNNNDGMLAKTFVSRGNHDNGSLSTWQGLWDFQSMAAAVGATNYSVMDADATYSFDYGNSHFSVVDLPLGGSNTWTSAEISWLDADLAAAEARGVVNEFLFAHGPMYTVTSQHSGEAPSAALKAVLNKHPISAGFFGHEHITAYSRVTSSRVTGINDFQQFTLGRAGAPPYSVAKAVDWSANQNAFADVAVNGTSFTVTVYAQSGSALFSKTFSQPTSSTINIGGNYVGSHLNVPGSSAQHSYSNIQAGPVQIHSSSSMLASERGSFGPYHTFNEVMGVPNNQLTTHYWFPWYDNTNMITWVLVGNPSTSAAAHVTIKIAGTTVGSYSIPPFGNVTPTFAIPPNGPVEILSDRNVFASERALMGYPSGAQSFDEVLGFPHAKLTTHYWFTWYDSKDMQTAVMIGNPSASAAAAVTIKIGGVPMGTYSVAPFHTLTVSYPGVQDGPVEVLANRAVFASERSTFGSSSYKTFNEVMGYPHNQLTSDYWFPWYDNTNMITWVLVGNPSTTQAANVVIKVGGVPVGYYTVPPFGNVTPTFAGAQNGPVEVTSDIAVFTSERVLKGYPGTGASFNEMMGIAGNKLTTDYWFTWYDNKDMTTQLVIGNP